MKESRYSAGNRFDVTIRRVPAADKAKVEAAFASLKATGFLNYFGLQRFGTQTVPEQ